MDWLLPPLVLALTAGLLRGGRTLLDRLMLAVAALAGASCVAGLLFTAWPFGFEPVAVAGTALTVLGAVGVTTGRRPRLPRPAFTDGLTVAAALAVTTYVGLPYPRTDSTGRLAMILGGDDHARHLAIYDTLRRLGGYALWQTPEQLPDLWDAQRYYPSGWHLTAGVLDGFVRSSTALGEMTSAMDHYIGFVVAGYGLFALALLWAAQWIAGPRLGAWRLPLVAFLCIQLVYSDLPTLSTYFGFPSEIYGLTLLTLLVAVLVRGARRLREQVVLVGALLVAVGFTYGLFLPPMLVAVGIWTVRRWRLVRTRPRFVAVVAAVAGPLSVAPIAVGLLVGGHATSIAALGGVLPMSHALLVALALLIAAAAVSPAWRGARVWRSYLWTVVAMATLPVTFLGYRLVTGNGTPYYGEKAAHAIFVVLLSGLGSVALLLPRPAPATTRGRPLTASRRWPLAAMSSRWPLVEVLPAVLLAAAVGSASGVVFDDTPRRPGQAETISKLWHSGEPARTNRRIAAEIVDLDRRFPAAPGTVTVVLTERAVTLLQTLYLSTLQRTSGRTDDVLYGDRRFSTDPDRLAASLARAGTPVVLIVSPAEDQLVADLRQSYPELPIRVVRP